MNAENKKTHTSVDESLEVFTPFPAYQQPSDHKHNMWLRRFKQLVKTKH